MTEVNRPMPERTKRSDKRTLATTSSGESNKPRRARRPTGEIRELILEAARASFEERGYARSTTRDIAQRAGVAEVLIFRQFGSKANLFAEAALLPVVDLLAAWVQLIDPSTDADAAEQQRQFIEHLYRIATENRGLLLSFFATGEFEPDVLAEQDAAAQFQRAIADIVDAGEQRLRRQGVDVSGMDVGISARATLGMVLAIALFGDWLMPKGRRRPKPDELVAELTRLSLYGFNPQRAPAPRKTARRR